MSSTLTDSVAPMAMNRAGSVLRSLVIGLTAFLTVVDLFATQAILPSLALAYGVSPAAMGTAVNACTLGMAVSGLAVALLGSRIDQRLGILVSLVVLAVPTALLASAPDLATFALLRIMQGVCMAAAFTLTLAYLGEHPGPGGAAASIAAYITGNVASNLVGRLVSAALADHFGLAVNFYGFAVLNLAGAALVFFTVQRTPRMPEAPSMSGPMMMRVAAWRAHLAEPALRAGFAIGFCILFAFIGTFTYVTFVLVGPRFGISRMMLGYVHLVFLPSILSTPLAGRAVMRFGTRPAFLAALAVAAIGLPLLLLPSVPSVLTGLALVAVGTFFAQAVATGFIGRAATRDRAAASGLYLASYFSGGLIGTMVLGRAFEALGWPGTVAGIGLALAVAAWLGRRLVLPAR